ncbi:MAG: hypothetical protein HKN32_08005 [Flavobacteriales bacterium]|nr:hypothetical protein [Flavobacteriales bacterium]
MAEHDPELYATISFNVYSPDYGRLASFKEHSEVLRPGPSIGKRYFEKLAKADSIVLFLAHHNKDFLGTKFFEMLPFRKPIAYFGDSGHVSHFIESNRLGTHIQDYQSFVDHLRAIRLKEQHFNLAYDVTQHSLPNVTEQLLQLLS